MELRERAKKVRPRRPLEESRVAMPLERAGKQDGPPSLCLSKMIRKRMNSVDELPRRLVAGRDPYAWKGTENCASAHVRPSGEGGCGNTKRNTAAMSADDEDDDH